MKTPIRPHSRLKVSISQVGAERAPVIVVDNFITNPEELVEDAATDHPFRPFALYYPGVKAPIPPMYTLAVYQILKDPIRTIFGLEGLDVIMAESDFRMVTQSSAGLHPRQLVPHYDGPDPNAIVVLHYLATRPFGGTSMYRHRATGFERIAGNRVDRFEETVNRELASARPDGFIEGDTALFERVASFPAIFNRALIYRGISLHSGDIATGPFDSDPRLGRLTANTVFLFGPPIPSLVAKRQQG
jgi:hypothetical protein